MSEMKPSAVVVIGDLVASRRATDRAALHRRLAEALDAVGGTFDGARLWLTAGDEYQGVFATLGQALQATLRVRLALLPEADVRHGVGCGPVETLDPETGIEDGPGWWAARAAIEAAAEAQRHAATRTARTAYRRADGAVAPGAPGAPGHELVDAALLGRDELVGRLSPRGLSVLRGLMAGRPQRDIAESEGISTSAVSQRVRNDGLGVLLAMDARMGELGEMGELR